jgi:O-antigen/teichoic acid export membrane protein
MSNLSETLNLQGVIVLINLFFAPYVVAAQAIANQVSGAMMQFVNNFRTAINPQIIKLYASGDRNDSKKLTLDTTIYCFDLVLMLGLPAIVVMDKLMDLWLVEVPPYAVIFTQWIIVRQIVSTFSASFYIPMMAANKMKVNSMASVFSGIGVFIVLYILFKNGCGPIWIQYIGLFSALMFSVLIKPYILCKDIDYSFIEILKCYWTCIKVTLISCLLSIPFVIILDNTIFQSVIKVIITFIAVVISSYLMMEKRMREKCVSIVKTRFLNFIK